MYGQKGFDYAFTICRTILGVVGLWPSLQDRKNKQFISSVLFNLTFLIIVICVNVPQTARLIIIWGELNEMSSNISTANLPIAVAVLKMCLIRSHWKALQRLLACALQDWRINQRPAEMTNMVNSAKLTRKISWICMMLGVCSVHGQVGVRLGQEFDIFPGPSEKRMPFVSSEFPFDYKVSPVYEVTCFLQYAGGILATLIYSGVYCLFAALVLHLHGQVANLRLDLEGLNLIGKWHIPEVLGMEFRHKIRGVINRHEYVNQFAADIENVFNIIFLAEILSCTIQLCMQLFVLVTLLAGEGEGKKLPIFQILFMTVFLMDVGAHVFICCYVCDKLRYESLSICESAYNFPWHDLPSKDSKLLIMVMLRAGKPLQVTAGKFFKFSGPLYTQMIKTSGGYLSMLLAVRDRVNR